MNDLAVVKVDEAIEDRFGDFTEDLFTSATSALFYLLVYGVQTSACKNSMWTSAADLMRWTAQGRVHALAILHQNGDLMLRFFEIRAIVVDNERCAAFSVERELSEDLSVYLWLGRCGHRLRC